MTAAITHLSYCLPEGILTHEELKDRFGSDEMDRLITNTGITSRRVALNEECASDLAFQAADSIFEKGDISPQDIDFVIFSSQMPDYLLPTTACILQDRLGIPKTAGAFDINLGCSQYIYSHATAFSFISSGLASKVLVMTGDTPSRIINPNDRSVVPLFGDGGTAAIIQKVECGQGYQTFDFGSDGSGSDSLIWPSSGLRRSKHTEELQEGKIIRTSDDMFMDGSKIFLFTLKTVPKTLKSFLEKNQLGVEDIDFFIFHQASEMILNNIVKKMAIPEDKFNRIYKTRGNPGGSSVGISLHKAISDKKILPGSKVVMSAFGVGLSWAHSLTIWPDIDVSSEALE